MDRTTDLSTDKENLISQMSQAELNPAERRLVEYLLSLSEFRLATMSTEKICEHANASRATIGSSPTGLAVPGKKSYGQKCSKPAKP